jgi:hypothetical protein
MAQANWTGLLPGPTYTISDWRISDWGASVGWEYLEQQN